MGFQPKQHANLGIQSSKLTCKFGISDNHHRTFGFSTETISGNPIEREREKEGTVDRSPLAADEPKSLLPPMSLRAAADESPLAADESPLAADVSESECLKLCA